MPALWSCGWGLLFSSVLVAVIFFGRTANARGLLHLGHLHSHHWAMPGVVMDVDVDGQLMAEAVDVAEAVEARAEVVEVEETTAAVEAVEATVGATEAVETTLLVQIGRSH